MKPTSEQAQQFAIMLTSGVPASDAILYFTESIDPAEIGIMLRDWLSSKALNAAMRAVEGAPWEELSLAAKIDRSLQLHYAGLAYCLYRKHYAEVGPNDQAKLDRARAALEAYTAGRAGQNDPLSQFFEDLKSGKLKLASKPQIIPS